MEARNNRKIRKGVVVSDKMDKTVVVKVQNLKLHPRYQKFIKRSKNFKAHDEANECRMGDTVEIIETRPLSKDKCWRVTKIIERSIEVASEG
ncbi:MAG: 30S ribosomal protein S17 [Denitrovibrio sp.]|nr:MAG: 30S ribosomal protein S17 [Denitrovibrio sp.]